MASSPELLVGDELQLIVRNEAVQLLGVNPAFIADWKINRIREDGFIDAWVPLDNIDTTQIPTDPVNVDRLIKQFDAHQQECGGGTGQRDAVVLGYVPTDKRIYMVDGFHRHDVQSQRGQSLLLATVEPNLTYEQVVKRQLEYARVHTEIEFARQVEWMQSVWERTPWASKLPNVLTAFRAIRQDYGHQGTDDVEQIDKLTDAEYDEVVNWVKQQSKEWGYTPKQIRENLAKAESFSPDLMRFVYQRSGKTPAGRIGLTHVRAISEIYGGEFDIQEAVVKIIIQEQLTAPETRAFLDELERGAPQTRGDVERLAEDVDFIGIKARIKKTQRTAGAISIRGAEGITQVTHSEMLDIFKKGLPLMQETAEFGGWTQADIDNAMEICLQLSETIAKLTQRHKR